MNVKIYVNAILLILHIVDWFSEVLYFFPVLSFQFSVWILMRAYGEGKSSFSFHRHQRTQSPV